jgi:hypothetical protein
MAEKERLIKEIIEHTGYFDFKALYSFAHSWLAGQEDYGVVEDNYAEKVSGATRDITVKWKATKEISDYFEIEIEVEFKVREISEVEVEIDGKRKKMDKGKVSIEIKGNIIRDPESKWDTSPFYRFMREVYNKYIIPGRIDKLEKKIKLEVITFKEELKSFLELLGKR